jgi:hypothetical protein
MRCLILTAPRDGGDHRLFFPKKKPQRLPRCWQASPPFSPWSCVCSAMLFARLFWRLRGAASALRAGA